VFTVQEKSVAQHGEAFIRNPLEWINDFWRNDTSSVETGGELHYSVVDAAAAIVEDAGPTYMCHFKRWSSAELPPNMKDRVYKTHGTLNVCAILLSCVLAVAYLDHVTCTNQRTKPFQRLLIQEYDHIVLGCPAHLFEVCARAVVSCVSILPGTALSQIGGWAETCRQASIDCAAWPSPTNASYHF
jgi:hypothetical protein